jgi:hypothetical protein
MDPWNCRDWSKRGCRADGGPLGPLAEGITRSVGSRVNKMATMSAISPLISRAGGVPDVEAPALSKVSSAVSPKARTLSMQDEIRGARSK